MKVLVCDIFVFRVKSRHLDNLKSVGDCHEIQYRTVIIFGNPFIKKRCKTINSDGGPLPNFDLVHNSECTSIVYQV